MDKKKRSVSEKRDRMLGFVTAMPAMILLFVFTVYPVFYLIYYSMFSGSLISAKKTFVGLDNYKELFGSETFRMVLVNTVVYTVLFVSLTMVLAVIIAVWMLTCYPVCNKAEGFDWFLYWIIAGCPFGIRRMCLWLIPKNFSISGSIGVLALNCIIGGLIGGVVLIFKIIGIAGELISIITGHFWTKSPKVEI